ncbi:MAG: PAS domain-containing protein [Bryobacteraceae bacterium]
MKRPQPTGREIVFGEEEIIVSKTDPRGVITYANPVFIRVAGYTEEELLGKAHNIVRHPDMPRCVFDLMWAQLKAGREIFAYVKNMARNGDHYWVHAHVTPTFDESGMITNYHSNRRRPDRSVVTKVEPIYRRLCEEERNQPGPRQALEAGRGMLESMLKNAGVTYDQLVWSL